MREVKGDGDGFGEVAPPVAVPDWEVLDSEGNVGTDFVGKNEERQYSAEERGEILSSPPESGFRNILEIRFPGDLTAVYYLADSIHQDNSIRHEARALAVQHPRRH